MKQLIKNMLRTRTLIKHKPTPVTHNKIIYTSTNGDVVIPHALTGFGANIISNTYSGGQGIIAFDGDVLTIGKNAFDRCSTLETIEIPNSVTIIDEMAFNSCYSLTSVTISDSVVNIKTGAFIHCNSLTSVVIPSSVSTIGGYGVFYNCSSLTYIMCMSTTPPTIGSSVFDNTNNCPIYVPFDSVNDYKTATNWTQYANRIKGYPSFNYVKFHSDGNNSLHFNNSALSLQYSYDSNIWYEVSDSSQYLLFGETDGDLYLRGKNTDGLGGATIEFSSNTALVDVDGSAMSLIDYDTLPDTVPSSGFTSLFQNAKALKTIGKYFLPANNVGQEGYSDMFYGCSSLSNAPSLPATVLGDKCYYRMFSNCSSLTSTPSILPSMNLTNQCYREMFGGCKSLTETPMLPSVVMENQCYYNMFYNCTALVYPPELPATTLATQCYNSMFRGCTSLVSTPQLSATILSDYCYYNMFSGCTSLEIVSVLPAQTLTNSCYRNMFYGCKLVNNITCLATRVTTTNTANWVDGVASTGTFTKKSGVTYPSGINGIPSGWEIIEI